MSSFRSLSLAFDTNVKCPVVEQLSPNALRPVLTPQKSSSQRKVSRVGLEDTGLGEQSISVPAYRRGGAWQEILISCNLLLKITES